MMMNPMMSAECCHPMSMMSGEFTSKNYPSWFNASTFNPSMSSPMMSNPMMSHMSGYPMLPSTMSSPMSPMPFSWMPSMMSGFNHPMMSSMSNPMWSNMMSSPMMSSSMMSSPMMSGWKNEAEMRNMPVRPSNWMESWSMSEPIRMDNFGNRCFTLNLDMHLYKPEEIKVSYKAANKAVVIEATCEEKFDPKATSPMSECSMLSASKGSCKRTYYREFVLPEECKIENLKCNMSFDGWLNFECVMPHVSSSPMTAPHMNSCPAFFNMPYKGYTKSISHRMDSIPVNVNIKA